MGQGQYDWASVAVIDDVHARHHDKGVSHGSANRNRQGWPPAVATQTGNLAHQLGTGELVGVAPHEPVPKRRLVVVYTEARCFVLTAVKSCPPDRL